MLFQYLIVVTLSTPGANFNVNLANFILLNHSNTNIIFMQPVTDVLFFSSRVLALYRCTRNKEYKRLMCIKEVCNGELMLPHHVNS